MKIVFGTDGWRAGIADEYTFDAVRVCAQSVAEWVVRSGGADRGVVVGFDRRFRSEHFANAAAEVVAAHDVRVHLATAAAPTQSFSWATMRRKAKAGIVITASHNPWTDNGFKVKAETGAAAAPDMLKELEAVIHPLEAHPERVRRIPLDEATKKGRLELFDPAPDYLSHVAELFDLEAFRGAGYTVVCEPLFGSASGYFPRLIGGGRTKVVELHAERNPFFGGVNPEPIPPNIDEFLRRIPVEHADVGLAVDGDADRAGLGDEKGTFVTTLTLYALLMWYLLEVRKLRKPVVKTVNMTSMADRLGAKYGVTVYEVPVGFKYIGPKMQETGAMMGGEESGGFGFAMHLPERDGIVADLFFLDFMLKTKKKPSQLIAELMDMVGPSYYLRRDLHFSADAYASAKGRIMAALQEAAPEQLGGHAVAKIVQLDTKDGTKFFLDDGSWLLIRLSGTEPLVRVYAETKAQDELAPLLDAGEKMVRGA
ncbi:MAG: phosphoglucomutase/phosphomannomutase family protein [Chloroflexi bacterium]|nr:MAG: phosphoglucomutase/phosphomannomutase family protein [Chloroflexota bacterium]TMG41930.1 MAG: phosphoglucomutase/phosphomannomutase family protein [Chloroflexota bacterium]